MGRLLMHMAGCIKFDFKGKKEQPVITAPCFLGLGFFFLEFHPGAITFAVRKKF